MSTVIAHGAGSSGRAARRLLGLESAPGIVTIEDRSGDVDRVADLIDGTVARNGDCTAVIGVSLGAHALIRWAAAAHRGVHLICVLPAWTGDPGSASLPTAIAAAQVSTMGIDEVLRRAVDHSPDVAELLAIAWADYTPDLLAACLTSASLSPGPLPAHFMTVSDPASIVGWYGDDFHPAATALSWARLLPQARIAMASRPLSALLRQALSTAQRPSPPVRAEAASHRPEASAWAAPPPSASPHLP
ncbi:MAG: hypothetical protein ACO3V1_00390 [Candidatus Nanopelagicales bacterium]